GLEMPLRGETGLIHDFRFATALGYGVQQPHGRQGNPSGARGGGNRTRHLASAMPRGNLIPTRWFGRFTGATTCHSPTGVRVLDLLTFPPPPEIGISPSAQAVLRSRYTRLHPTVKLYYRVQFGRSFSKGNGKARSLAGASGSDAAESRMVI